MLLEFPPERPYPHWKVLHLRAVSELGKAVHQELCGLQFLLRGALPPSHFSRQLAQVAESGNGKCLTIGGAEFCGSGRRTDAFARVALAQFLFEFRAGRSRCDIRSCTCRAVGDKVTNLVIDGHGRLPAEPLREGKALPVKIS